jgi:hypothetical protein
MELTQYLFKRTVPRDFLLQVFFMNHFLPSPEKNIRVISIFFANLRRYSQVKVHQRYQRYRWQIATGIKDTGGKFATGGLLYCLHCAWAVLRHVLCRGSP